MCRISSCPSFGLGLFQHSNLLCEPPVFIVVQFVQHFDNDLAAEEKKKNNKKKKRGAGSVHTAIEKKNERMNAGKLERESETEPNGEHTHSLVWLLGCVAALLSTDIILFF